MYLIRKIIISIICIVSFGLIVSLKPKQSQSSLLVNYYASTKKHNTAIYSVPAGSIIGRIEAKNTPIFIRYCKDNWCNVLLSSKQIVFISQHAVHLKQTAFLKNDCYIYNAQLETISYIKKNVLVEIINKNNNKLQEYTKIKIGTVIGFILTKNLSWML